MNVSSDHSISHENRESWLPLLQLAAQEVFEIMLGSKLELAPDHEATPSDITSMVGLAGQLCGVFTLRCNVESAKLMACRMLGIEPDQADQQMWDAVGEICNMVAGNFKNKLTGLSDRCMLSVPTVITGGDYSFHSLADSGVVEFVMMFEKHPIAISLEVHT
jgi:chemotaxis protein CheX